MQKFKNDVYLVERTKLLEGILCQSLTFTNSKGVTYNSDPLPNAEFVLYLGEKNQPGFTENQMNTAKNLLQSTEIFQGTIGIKSVFQLTEQTIPFNDIVQEYGNKLFQNPAFETLGWTGATSCSGTLNMTVSGTTYAWNSYQNISANVSFTPNSEIKLVFSLTFYNGQTIITTAVITVEASVYAVDNRYPLKPYTITDCICRCLELCKPLKMGELPQYRLQGVTYSLGENNELVRTIQEGSQADRYNKIIAPNFSMTQCHLREQLKIIGGNIHGEARLGYSANGTGLDYEPDVIYFEEYGQETETNLAENGYVYRGIAQSINDYCTKVTTDAANIVNTINYEDGTITDPGYNASRTLRTESTNVLLSESVSEIYTQFPVYSIDKVLCGMFNSNGDGYQIPLSDITAYIFEAHEYNSTLSSYEGTYPYSKAYGLYYTQGQRNIKGLFFKVEDAVSPALQNYAIANILASVTGESASSVQSKLEDGFDLLCFQVTYTPIYSAKFSHGKSELVSGEHEFTKIYSQAENLIETSYFGESIKGVAERMSNQEETRTYILPDVTYLPKAGQELKTPNGNMVITDVTTGYYHNYLKCTVTLTKRFNSISRYVGIKSHKRISEVSELEAYERNTLIQEYCIIGDKSDLPRAKLVRNTKLLAGAIVGGDTDLPITAAVCAGVPKKYFNESGAPSYYNGVMLPVVSSAFGNVMLFTWEYKDNFSAGQRLLRTTDSKGNKQRWIQDVPYCDYYGRFYWLDFALSNDLAIPLANQLNTADGKPASNNTFGYPHKTPNAPIRTSRVEQGVTQYFNPILYRKDSREVPHISFAIEYITNRSDFIIGSAIAQKCTLVGTDPSKRQAYVYFFSASATEQFNFGKFPKALSNLPFDKQGNPIEPIRRIAIGQDNLSQEADGSYKISFELPTDLSGNVLPFSNWCIAYEQTTETVTYSDEDGNTVEIPTVTGGEIVLACNNNSGSYTDGTIEFFVTTSNTNLKGV